MKVRFQGFEQPIEVSRGRVSVLEVRSKRLFSRLCQSLASSAGEEAMEPYSLWADSGDRIKERDAFLVVSDPLNLPWDDRRLNASLYGRFENLLFEDDLAQLELEQLNLEMRSVFAKLGLQMCSDYAFSIDWDAKKYLKAFGYGVEYNTDEPLFDNLIKFVSFVADSGFEDVLLFVGLGNYLDEKELSELLSRVIFLELQVLSLESRRFECGVQAESKIVIDQDFLSYEVCWKDGMSVPPQREICSNGFGAVTF